MSNQVQSGLFDHLFDAEPPALDPVWGDRFIRRDREPANVKPYGRREPEPETFDPKLAAELTSNAIERADEHADPDWKAVFFRTLIDVAVSEESFTTDEIWKRLEGDPNVPKTHERRAAGAIVLRAAKAGVIKMLPDQFRTSQRAHCHGSLLRVYASKIYGKDATQFYGLAQTPAGATT
jgi:hypothetical protein